jgi:hypothetical protein
MAVAEIVVIFLALVALGEEIIEDDIVVTVTKVFLEAFAGLDVGQAVVGGESAFGEG